MNAKQTKQVAVVRDTLEGLGPKIQAIAPTALNLDRFVGVVTHAVQKTPKLLDCDPTSLLSAVMESAALGLTPSGVLGESYLVPRGGAVNLQVGYKGLVKLALESGQVRQIVARPVYAKDRFTYSFGLEEDTFEHVPTEDAERGDVVRAYAIARMIDGPAQLEVTALADILQAKAVAQTSNVWNQWFGAMAAKTSVRRLCRLLTLSPEYHRALAIDDGEIAPGITVHHAPGHSKGLQCVRVMTDNGPVVVAADAAHFYENYEHHKPFVIVADMGAMLRGFDRLVELAGKDGRIVPGHDPLVRERYPQVFAETGLDVRRL